MSDLKTAAQQALEALEDMLGWQSLAPQTIQESAKGRAAALRTALAEPVQQGCDHCNHPLYAATRCRVCGRVTEPVQEPVAYSVGCTLHWHQGKGVSDAQLFAAPPQRKPLTEEDIERLLSKHERNYDMVKFARAIERAHGIKE